MESTSPQNPFLDTTERSLHDFTDTQELGQWYSSYGSPANLSVHSPVTTETKLKRPRATWLRWWQIELITELLAIACMMAIMGVLLGFQNRPISAWPYHSFSLNSVIALLATIARTALMFPVMACMGQRKWQWFSPSQRRKAAEGFPQRQLRDFEIFDDSSRSSLGSLNFLWRINVR